MVFCPTEVLVPVMSAVQGAGALFACAWITSCPVLPPLDVLLPGFCSRTSA